MKAFRGIIKNIFSLDTRMTEMYLALTSLSWGLWLLLPGDSFSSTPTFSAMQALAPELVWGAAYFGAGMFRATGILLNKPKLRGAAATVGATLWAFAAAMFTVSNFISTAVPIYSGISLTSLWVAICLKAQEG